MFTFSSFSFGCRVNEAEKENLDKKMLEAGFYFDEKNPDIFIINTCAVTHKAEREARNLIYQIKRKNPKTKIVITGCAATFWQKNKLYQNLPIDLLIDNVNKEFLVELIKKRFKKNQFEMSRSIQQTQSKQASYNKRCDNVILNLFQDLNGMPKPACRQAWQVRHDRHYNYYPEKHDGKTDDFHHSPSESENKLVSGYQKILKQASKFLSSGRLLIKIQDGCQRFCTYCIVPYLRGMPKSRKIEEIIGEINNTYHLTLQIEKSKIIDNFSYYKHHCHSEFISESQKEIPKPTCRQARRVRDDKKTQTPISEVILTAVNTEAFGLDTGENFADLIDQILKKTSIPRLSFGSIHPWSITSRFINFYQKISTQRRLVNFFHIPIQSGSNTILQLMKRGYKTEEILEKLSSLQKINPLSLLATDVIVGFLGETEKEFEETYRFLEKSPLVKFHIFRFSKRKNTAAFYMAKNLNEPTEEEKKKRAKALGQLSAKKYLKFLEKNLGRISTALILNKKHDGFFEALLDNQLPVLIEKKKNIGPGEIIKVKVERVKNGRLVGK